MSESTPPRITIAAHRPLVALVLAAMAIGGPACSNGDVAAEADERRADATAADTPSPPPAGSSATPASPASPAHRRYRGVGWVAGRAITVDHLRPLVDAHVDWIAQTPFGWSHGRTSPGIDLVTGGRVYWGETDEGLRVTTDLARSLGIGTVLKPHIWLRDGSWCGEIAMTNETDWRAWFDSYERFIVHYARLAEELGIAVLCVGTELEGTTYRTPDWRRVIRAVRAVYGGKLTFGANWSGEFEQILFWDDLDYIGVHAYFPLATAPSADVDALARAWEPWLARLETVQRTYGKPVVFTEIGYRSTADAGVRPWEWPKRGDTTPMDESQQAALYAAFFETVWPRPWFRGAFFWKWYPMTSITEPVQPRGFTPQGKAALGVMSGAYAAPEP